MQGHSPRTGLMLRPRPHDRQPRNPFCPLHLRRICGVCAHFRGPRIRSEGDCDKYRGKTRGTACAADCPDWSRKWAEGG